MRYLYYLLFLLPQLIWAQTTAITGTVVDAENREPLIGASIQVKGRAAAAVTDLDGYFELTGLQPGRQVRIKITYTGYSDTTVVALPGDRLGTIALGASNTLEEVVVVGYSAQQRRAIDRSAYNSMSNAVAGAAYDRGRPERYNAIQENGFVATEQQAISTLSTDVDRASYANVRRFILDGSLPPTDAVRSEEMINYFAYDDPAPAPGVPLALTTEIGECPWNPQHRVLRVGLRAQDIEREELPPANLVFLLDVSGSMQGPDRLGLLKQSMLMLTEQLRPQDRVAIVVYAGAAGLVLPSTAGDRGAIIREAITQLEAGGSTAGGAGIALAYLVARENFIEGGNNRVILATDGDFNVGPSDQESLVEMIERKRETGIYLTVLGFGRGNYQEGTMQELADRGNGNHAYIDGELEARKTLIEEFGGTLVTVAKDVKVQLAFDPAAVRSYRLIGYENRLLDTEDFDDDRKDAGEMGAGHRVTVLYELVPTISAEAVASLGELRVRYKSPQGGRSRKLSVDVPATVASEPTENLRWATAVAEFAMLLRDSEYLEQGSYTACIARARRASGSDEQGYRRQMIELMEQASRLAR